MKYISIKSKWWIVFMAAGYWILKYLLPHFWDQWLIYIWVTKMHLHTIMIQKVRNYVAVSPFILTVNMTFILSIRRLKRHWFSVRSEKTSVIKQSIMKPQVHVGHPLTGTLQAGKGQNSSRWQTAASLKRALCSIKETIKKLGADGQ